ncbi:TPA: hypothetical protein ACHGWQ_006093 [Escherichia coli]|uniref:hypothetical protein n=1 Tax=Escherichia coli TaxID=562 RepID=UPI000B42C19B|nr:hypothetical protein [Escherichia coli]EFK7891665.1 hypothetical protein [Escherichia coli]NPT87814.1 hypothetical protein [Escherichia coli]OWE26670.1 hypothetical protein A8M46_23135 [Escherichia coli]RCP06457.1 hypothetical protein A6585_17000 [Escherichia coli]HAG7994779.1 hypothetical protein [Escherichia coli]
MSNKIENPVVLIHKRENHDSYAVAITNGSHDYYDGLLMASVSPDEADNSFAVFAMVGYYMAAEIEKLRAQRDALAAENAALKESERAFDAMCAEEHGDNWVSELTETPATDAFLAEVRAQGVEMYADNLDNGADDAERGGFDDAVKFLRSEASGVRLFADQLRKGGNQ